jgi:hypothetical protein
LRTEPRRLIGPKREEVAGGWRRLRNEELHNLYTSPNIVRVIKSERVRWVGHGVRIGEMRNAYNILVGKPKQKKPPGTPKRRCGEHIRSYLKEIGWEVVDWIHLSRDRDSWWVLQNTVMYLRLL